MDFVSLLQRNDDHAKKMMPRLQEILNEVKVEDHGIGLFISRESTSFLELQTITNKQEIKCNRRK